MRSEHALAKQVPADEKILSAFLDRQMTPEQVCEAMHGLSKDEAARSVSVLHLSNLTQVPPTYNIARDLLCRLLQGVVDVGQRMNDMNEKIRHLGPFSLLGDSLSLILQVAGIELQTESVCFVRFNTAGAGAGAGSSRIGISSIGASTSLRSPSHSTAFYQDASLGGVGSQSKSRHLPTLHSTVSRPNSGSLKACYANAAAGHKVLPFGTFPYGFEEEEIVVRALQTGGATSACVLSDDSAPWLRMRTELL